MLIQQRVLNSPLPIINLMRACSSSSASNQAEWSYGKKEKPKHWKFVLENFFKIPDHKKFPHHFDPKDPEQKYPYKLPDGGIQYFNFVYYPRSPDHKEPKIEPTKLFLVYRRRPLKHRPYWEKNIMKKLGIDQYGVAKATIVKNIPEMNGMLWQVKHLVTIKPLKLPENFCEDTNPLHYFIQENGEVIYQPSVKIGEKDLEIKVSEKDMDQKYISTQTRKIYDISLNLDF